MGLKFAGFLLSFAFILGAGSAKAEVMYGGAMSVMQGATDETSTQFAVLVDVTQTYRVEVEGFKSHQKFAPLYTKIEKRSFSNIGILKAAFQGLSLGEDYYLKIFDSAGKALDRRIFRTLDTSKVNPRVAYASCMADYLQKEAVWTAMVNSSPDLIVLEGDNVYADRFDSNLSRIPADEQWLWMRYVSTRASLVIFKVTRLIPMITVWDDHDTGMDNSDRTYSYMGVAAEVYKSFFNLDGNVSANYKRGPGISSVFKAFGQNYFLLDGRSFRDPVSQPLPRLMYGSLQDQWFFEQLQNVKGPINVIGGSQFFCTDPSGPECMERDYYPEWVTFLNELRKTGQPVVFNSGDVHYSEISEIEKVFLGFPTLEITSSSIHSLAFPGNYLRVSNDRRVEATWHYNFVMVESHVKDGIMVGRADSIGADRQIWFSYPFIVRVK